MRPDAPEKLLAMQKPTGGFGHAGSDRIASHAASLLPVRRNGRIGLLGGSFDPPHEGHVRLTEWALKKFDIDIVWWLVSPGNPLKDGPPSPAAVRLTEIEKFRRPGMVPVDFEIQTGTDRTHATITRLISLCPQAEFVWLMGADNLSQIHRWEQWRKIFRSVPIGVMARPGHALAALNSVAARTFQARRVGSERVRGLAGMKPPAWAFVRIPLSGASSSEIRQRRDRKI